jgi:hypothetical protein
MCKFTAPIQERNFRLVTDYYFCGGAQLLR